jgi:hypothetical protein
MAEFKFEMIERVAADEHAGYFFFIIEFFSERPFFAGCNFGRRDIHHHRVAEKGIGVLCFIGLEAIPKLNDFFQCGLLFTRRGKKVLCAVQIFEGIESAGVNQTFNGFFIDTSLIHSFDEIKKIFENYGVEYIPTIAKTQ